MKRYHFFSEKGLSYSIDDNLMVDLGLANSLSIPVNNILPDRYSLIKRLLRNGIYAAYECDRDKIVIVCSKKILIYLKGALKAELEIDRGSRPLRQGISCLNGFFYYGDYWGNPEKKAVNLYRVNLSNYKKEVFFKFNHIRHIHFVQKDTRINNALLVGTGDSNSESGIYRLDLNNRKLKTIVEGSQQCRAVSVLQENKYLIWGTDAPDEQNYIFRFNRETNDLQKTREIDGPAYYSTKTKNGDIYLATTIEDRLRHKACIYKSIDQGLSWDVYKSFKKDIWHSKYFGYGIIEFIYGQTHRQELFYNLVGLKEK